MLGCPARGGAAARAAGTTHTLVEGWVGAIFGVELIDCYVC
ncbi:hypothetical protein [Micromonospora sp. NPDC002717]